MKLRNLFIAAFAAVGLFSSCEDKSGLGALAIELSDYELELKAAGEEKSIKVSASEDWFAEVDWKGVEAWLDISPAEGNAGENQTVVITATDNSNGYDRSIDVKFSIGVKSKWLKVTQPGGKGELVKEYAQLSAVRTQTPAASGSKITLGNNILVKGTVVSNSALNNMTSRKTCYIQDETGGIQIYFAENHSFAFGDVVEVDLSGATLENYSGAAEINGLPLDKAVKISSGSTVVPKLVTMADYLANKYEGQYIEIDATVQVASNQLSRTWFYGDYSAASIYLEDAAGNQFCVRSSQYSSFASETVPQGSGKIKGIATIYVKDSKTTMQLAFAQASDYAGLTGERFTSTSGGGSSPDTAPENAIFYESFKSGLGDFTIENTTVPSEIGFVWSHSETYNCAIGTAYVGGDAQLNYAADARLISPEIDLTNQTAAYLSFEHAGGWFKDAATDASLWIQKDGGEWQQLAISEYPSGYSFITEVQDLTAYLGSKVKFAFKYHSTAEKAGTWEIKEFAVIAGTYEAPVVPTEPTEPEGTKVVLTTNSSDLEWTTTKDATYGDGYTATSDNVTVAYYKHGSTSAIRTPDSGHIRVYKNSVLKITIPEGSTLKYVKLATEGGDHCNEYTITTGSVVKIGKNLFWTGELTTPFIAEMSGGQNRIKEVTVVY